MDYDEPQKQSSASPGKIVFWCFLAALTLLLIWQFFQIQDDCAIHKYRDDWQSNLC